MCLLAQLHRRLRVERVSPLAIAPVICTCLQMYQYNMCSHSGFTAHFVMQKCVGKGYTPMIAPDLVRDSVLEKCGFQPRMANTQTYSVADSDLCLTGTAEVPLGGVYMDKIVEEKELPIRMAAYGHCFRTEAGAAGMAGKGLYRVHQFSKVEMFVVCTPEQSEQMLDELMAIEVRFCFVVAASLAG